MISNSAAWGAHQTAGLGQEREEEMEFDTLSFDIDRVSTVVKAIGKGPAVIALHGAMTIEGHQWARALADRFRVYLPFHPGFGESGPAPHVRGMQDLVIHYLHLLPALKVDRPHLVGRRGRGRALQPPGA
jgi:pimeloyl-ACP methyl ester carboxylesterase